VIAFDPGKETGWARMSEGEFASGQAPLWDVVDWLWSALDGGLRPTIFCEDFIITTATAKKSRQTDPLDGIGAIKWMAHRFDLALYMQSPSQAKTFATDDKLKVIGWYKPTKGGHANDAARHLMVGLVGQKILDPRQLLTEE
jgi:hypothetical protein